MTYTVLIEETDEGFGRLDALNRIGNQVFYTDLVLGGLSGFEKNIYANDAPVSFPPVWTVPWLWWACIVVGAPIVAFLQYRGIRISTRTVVVLGAAEILIVLALAITGFANPGPGGVSLGVFNFGNTVINLLKVSQAPELIAPATVAGPEAGSRMQFSIEVDDVDAMAADLQSRGVQLLNGPMNRPWGIRTASFQDPAGYIWEIVGEIPG